MAIQSSYDYKGLTAPTAYARMSGVKWADKKTIQVYVDVYALKAQYDAAQPPLETKIYTLDFPTEQADVPGLGNQALLDSFNAMATELYQKLLAESEYSGGSIVP